MIKANPGPAAAHIYSVPCADAINMMKKMAFLRPLKAVKLTCHFCFLIFPLSITHGVFEEREEEL